MTDQRCRNPGGHIETDGTAELGGHLEQLIEDVGDQLSMDRNAEIIYVDRSNPGQRVASDETQFVLDSFLHWQPMKSVTHDC